jgi:hypothetical protein
MSTPTSILCELFILEIDLPQHIVLQGMRYIVCVGKVETLGYLDVLESLDISSFLFTSLTIPA